LQVGFAMLRDLSITLIAANSPASFLEDGPTSKLLRQILGAVSEFDNAVTVPKLRAGTLSSGLRPRMTHEEATKALSLLPTKISTIFAMHNVQMTKNLFSDTD
jgi:hypothetical protein